MKGFLFSLGCLATLMSRSFAADSPKTNVLFIASDDLRPQLGCYGHEKMITPHLDALAARGMVFERAYCQAAVCRASRLSLLTGRRPDTTRVHTNGGPIFRTHSPDWVTLPQHFKIHGWKSLSLGKIFHGAFKVRSQWNDRKSWSEPEWWPGPRYYYTEAGVAAARKVFQQKRPNQNVPVDDWVNHFVLGPSWEAPDVEDNVLYDGKVADKAIETLRNLQDESFFLAVGFLKPHLPFIAPKKYWDLYPPGSLAVADNPQAPEGAPSLALTNWGHPRSYSDFPNRGNPSGELVEKLTRGYAACVSFVDAQVGRILEELDRLDLRDNTIVVFWGDHGYHLGENAIWGKATNFELSARVPLIISAPGMAAAGGRTRALVELVDLYPTLSEFAGLPIPETLEGTSLAPLLDAPEKPWKAAAFSQYPRDGVMGQSLRTNRWRFTRWTRGKETVALELYDLETDPDSNVNLAGEPEHSEEIESMGRIMDAGWQAVRP